MSRIDDTLVKMSRYHLSSYCFRVSPMDTSATYYIICNIDHRHYFCDLSRIWLFLRLNFNHHTRGEY